MGSHVVIFLYGVARGNQMALLSLVSVVDQTVSWLIAGGPQQVTAGAIVGLVGVMLGWRYYDR